MDIATTKYIKNHLKCSDDTKFFSIKSSYFFVHKKARVTLQGQQELYTESYLYKQEVQIPETRQRKISKDKEYISKIYFDVITFTPLSW